MRKYALWSEVTSMVTLNDYLYSGDTVLKILQKYTEDLRREAKENYNEIDLVHSNFLLQRFLDSPVSEDP